MDLSEHFTLEEFTFSETAARLGLGNSPTVAIVRNLGTVASAMERIRTLLGDKPINVHSGYRAPAVNEAVGGVATSAHCFGLACDFVCPAFGAPYDVAVAIQKSDVEYDQLILEYGWVHLGLTRDGAVPRREALTKRSPRAGYEAGLKA